MEAITVSSGGQLEHYHRLWGYMSLLLPRERRARSLPDCCLQRQEREGVWGQWFLLLVAPSVLGEIPLLEPKEPHLPAPSPAQCPGGEIQLSLAVSCGWEGCAGRPGGSPPRGKMLRREEKLWHRS